MDIQLRILHMLRRAKDGVLLRSDFRALGTRFQVSRALLSLRAEGLIERIAEGVYASPSLTARYGKRVLLQRARLRNKEHRKFANYHRTSVTAVYAETLAKQAKVNFVPTFTDRWANTVTRLAGDDPKSDSTDDRLVALTRAGRLSPNELVKMVIAHHRHNRAV